MLQLVSVVMNSLGERKPSTSVFGPETAAGHPLIITWSHLNHFNSHTSLARIAHHPLIITWSHLNHFKPHTSLARIAHQRLLMEQAAHEILILC
jgi:hypothetical protein